MMKRTFCAVILFFGLLNAQQYNFINYGIEQGLPEVQIQDICQDDFGYLYFSSMGAGLTRFDGKNFVSFTIADGLAGNNVRSLMNDSENRLWVGTDQGLSIYSKGEFINYTGDSLFASNIIWKIFEDKKGSVLLGTDRGITIYKNGNFRKLSSSIPQLNRAIWDIKEDKSGNYWVASNAGLVKITKKDTVVFNADKGYGASEAIAVKIASDGSIWVGTNNRIFHSFDGEKFNEIKIPAPMTRFAVWEILEDKNNTVWICTTKGVLRLKEENLTWITEENGLVFNAVYSGWIDNEDNLWFGTSSGLSRLTNESFVLYPKKSGLEGGIVWTILKRKNGDLLAGTEGFGIKIKKGEKFVDYLKGYGLDSAIVYAITEDKKGRLWIGTLNSLYFLENGKITDYFKSNGLPRTTVMKILENDGNIWVATHYEGVFKITGSSYVQYLEKDGLPGNLIDVLAVDKYGNIVAGSETGLAKLINGRFRKVKGFDSYQGFAVMDLEYDSQGTLWVGMYNKGLVGLNKGGTKVLTELTEKDGLNDNSILFIEKDNNNVLWIGTNKGLNYLRLDDLYVSGKTEIYPYHRHEGFQGLETNQGASFADEEGKIWYGCIKGVVVFNPKTAHDRILDFPLFITGLKINYEAMPLEEFGDFSDSTDFLPSNLKLPYNRNHLTFEYNSLFFRDPYKINYSYKIEGLEKSWSPQTNLTSVTYSNIPAGNYTFRLRTFIGKKEEPFKEISYAFVIKKPFWSTWWFYVGAGLLFVSLITVLYKQRMRRINRETARLQEIIKQRLEYEAKLQESEKDYREIFENAHDTILVSDPEKMIILDANKSASKLYGYTRSELIGMPLKNIIVNYEKSLNKVNVIMSSGGNHNYETTHKTKEGKIVELNLNGAIVYFKGKKALLTILQDITSFKETEKALREAKNIAEKSDRLKSEFLAQMSHEIRTPVNTILNFTSLLEAEFSDNRTEEVDVSFDMIRRGGERLIQTIDSILNMSQIQTGNFETNFREISLFDDVVKPVCRQLNKQADRKGLKLIYSLAEKPDKIYGDKFSIEHLLINLMDNAIKYTHKGEVNVGIVSQNNHVDLIIKDTGVGIAEEYLPKLFTPFSQEETGYTRAYEGNGLGLALVKKYVEINNASVTVESEKGKGTTFTVRFKKNADKLIMN